MKHGEDQRVQIHKCEEDQIKVWIENNDENKNKSLVVVQFHYWIEHTMHEMKPPPT